MTTVRDGVKMNRSVLLQVCSKATVRFIGVPDRVLQHREQGDVLKSSPVR